jgi:ABC-2 type transport system ATP-binding protein
MDAGRLVLESDLDCAARPDRSGPAADPDPAAVVAALDGGSSTGPATASSSATTTRRAQRAARRRRVRVAELVPERRSLEQVVLELTGHGADRVDAPRAEARP